MATVSPTCRTAHDMPPTISLVIPTFKREDVLVDCLRTVLNQKVQPFEILVVDQTTDHKESTSTFLKNHESNIFRLIQAIPSLTKARNTGAQSARGSHLVFIDDDTLLPDDFISNYQRSFTDGYMAVQGGITEPGKQIIADRPPWFSNRGFWHGASTCVTVGLTNIFTGANFGVSRDVYCKLSGFDEGYEGVALREDSDFGLRCHASGCNIRFDPSCRLFHRRESTGGVDAHLAKGLIDQRALSCEVRFAHKHLSTPWRELYLWRVQRRCGRAIRRAMHKITMDYVELSRR
jgi:glycosyltransferase involved in cell wall biosynthesis